MCGLIADDSCFRERSEKARDESFRIDRAVLRKDTSLLVMPGSSWMDMTVAALARNGTTISVAKNAARLIVLFILFYLLCCCNNGIMSVTNYVA